MTRIQDAHILLTGGAGGLGRELALRMARLGGRITIWDIADPAKIHKDMASSGVSCRAVQVDLADKEQIRQAAATTLQTAPVDILINNAGIVSAKPFSNLTDKAMEATMAVNFMAIVWTLKAILPHMQARDQGHIVTIASAAGLIGAHKLSLYCASKSAAFGFNEALRMELRQTTKTIKTLIVCPYYFNTSMFAGVNTRYPLLLPILHVDKVAARIIRAIRKNKKQLIMPFLVRLLPLFRLFPPGFLDFWADALGINQGLRHMHE